MKKVIILAFSLVPLLHGAALEDDIAIVKIENSFITEIIVDGEPTSDAIMSLPDATVISSEINSGNDKAPVAPVSTTKAIAEDDMAIVKMENSVITEIIVEGEPIPDTITSLPDATVISGEKNSKVSNTSTIKMQSEPLPIEKAVQNEQAESKKINIVKAPKALTIVNYLESPKKVCMASMSEKIDFWKLLDKAMIHATAMILKKHDIQITEKNMDIVKSEYYPKISLGYSGEYYHGFGRDGSSIGGSYYPGTSQYRDALNLTLKHELYHFGATDLKMQMSQKDVEIIKSELLLVQQDLANELLSDYVEAVKAQENIRFKDDMRMVQDRIIQKKWRLYESGEISKTILLKDQLALANLEKEILNYKMNYMDIVKKIQILTNLEINPSQAKLEIPTPKNSTIVPFEESAVAKNLELNLEKKLQELELIKKDYKPTLYANSSYRLYGADSDSFRETIKNLEKNSWDVGVSFQWELFSGFKTDSTVQKAKIEVQKLVEKYRLAKLDYESRKVKREMLQEAIDKILRVESQILNQTCEQEDVLGRLQRAGQVSTIELDMIELNKIRSELNFRLGVIDGVYETIKGELIL